MSPEIVLWWAEADARIAARNGDNIEMWFQRGKAAACREILRGRDETHQG